MATVTAFTAERSKEIENATLLGAHIDLDGHLILERFDGGEIDAGGALGTTVNDTLANLTATNPVIGDGVVAVTNDTVPQIFAVGDGVTGWNLLPKFEARGVSQTASYNGIQTGITNAGYTDRTGLSVTFTVGAVPWVVEVREPFPYGTTAGVLPTLVIRDAANVVKAGAAGIVSSVASVSGLFGGSAICAMERITTPGTYSRKASVTNASASGTAGFGAGVDTYMATLIARPER
jgi:hypothetical protein